MASSDLQFYSSSYGQQDPYQQQQQQQQQQFGQGGIGGADSDGFRRYNSPPPQGFATAFGITGAPGFENEPPLLEELGVNFEHIQKKAMAVLNPAGKALDHDTLDDDDLAGPLLFCLIFGGSLLLAGKVHFGYIYGLALLGCVGVYTILNLMSDGGINGTRTASILGYCLLPMNILAFVSVFVELNGWLGLFLGLLIVAWCTYSSSTMFVNVLSMNNQRALIAYPISLLYTSFALMAVF